MADQHSWEDRREAVSAGAHEAGYYSAALAERHQRMIVSAGHRLAHELGRLGCPAPRVEIARRCGVDHWSQSTLEEAVLAAEREGLLQRLPLGWLAPARALGTDTGPQRSGKPAPERAQHGGRGSEPLAESASGVEA